LGSLGSTVATQGFGRNIEKLVWVIFLGLFSKFSKTLLLSKALTKEAGEDFTRETKSSHRGGGEIVFYIHHTLNCLELLKFEYNLNGQLRYSKN
jgi:hypothetical protein